MKEGDIVEMLKNLDVSIYIHDESPCNYGESSDYKKVEVELRYKDILISKSYDTFDV